MGIVNFVLRPFYSTLNHELFIPRLFHFIMPANKSDIPRDKVSYTLQPGTRQRVMTVELLLAVQNYRPHYPLDRTLDVNL
jgi:hypothetical protein